MTGAWPEATDTNSHLGRGCEQRTQFLKNAAILGGLLLMAFA